LLVEPHEETWMENLTGRTALVTGSTDGVGRLVARKLGQAGGRVLVHGRDAERGARVVAEIEAAGGTASFLAADLSSLEEVRRLAGAVQVTVGRLDILINNAGIGTAGPRQTSAEGFELRFTVNYLAGFLLTLLLLPSVKNSAPARIVNVSSAGQQPIDFDDVMLTGGYSGARAYCQSKLAQIMFTIDWRLRSRVPCHGHVSPPRHLHGYAHGAAGWSEAIEHGRRRRAGDPQSRHIPRGRGADRALFQRPTGGRSARPSL
jgi:NAD(P)-dependent dehydrogenase (short-subunit alcohol dehydrogenase family)